MFNVKLRDFSVRGIYLTCIFINIKGHNDRDFISSIVILKENNQIFNKGWLDIHSRQSMHFWITHNVNWPVSYKICQTEFYFDCVLLSVIQFFFLKPLFSIFDIMYFFVWVIFLHLLLFFCMLEPLFKFTLPVWVNKVVSDWCKQVWVCIICCDMKKSLSNTKRQNVQFAHVRLWCTSRLFYLMDETFSSCLVNCYFCQLWHHTG